mmetsp:Transcript_73706/g.149635  ORF Transcript_73706/g.149635 Transcript_73706/m.149635 type:complete len:231 (-) Transcript_73706:35-727(-)
MRGDTTFPLSLPKTTSLPPVIRGDGPPWWLPPADGDESDRGWCECPPVPSPRAPGRLRCRKKDASGCCSFEGCADEASGRKSNPSRNTTARDRSGCCRWPSAQSERILCSLWWLVGLLSLLGWLVGWSVFVAASNRHRTIGSTPFCCDGVCRGMVAKNGDGCVCVCVLVCRCVGALQKHFGDRLCGTTGRAVVATPSSWVHQRLMASGAFRFAAVSLSLERAERAESNIS